MDLCAKMKGLMCEDADAKACGFRCADGMELDAAAAMADFGPKNASN